SHGLYLHKTIGDLSFIAQYKPEVYLQAQNIVRGSEVQKRDKKEEYLHFNFRIESNATPLQHGNPSKEAYFQRLSYLTFDIEQDFRLLEGQDTLYPATFQFVQNYSLAPYIDYVISFKRKNSTKSVKEEIYFIYDDKVFGVGK